MNSWARKIFSVAIITIIGLSGCGGEAPKPPQTEGKLERMKPKNNDNLVKLMDRSWNNLEYILYGFINYDNEKIKKASDNLKTISGYMPRKITSAYKEHKTEWTEQCNRQRDIVANIKVVFEQQDFDESRKQLMELTGICMDCHKQYRKYLKPKQKLDAVKSGELKPKDDDSLAKLMDRGWDNLKYMMYGIINYDAERIKTSTENIIALSDYTAKGISLAYQAHGAEWKEQCDTQKELAANIGNNFKQENFDELQNNLLKLIENCMECHKVYRKHLLTPQPKY